MGAVLVSAVLAALALPADPGWTGTWEGELEYPRAPLVATVTISRAGNALEGTLAIRGATKPLEALRVDGGRIRFEVPQGDGVLRFDGRRDGARIAGETSGVVGARFLLRRLPDRPRPRDRVEAWRQDLDALEARFLRHDRSFSREARARFRRAVADLRAALSMRTDAEVLVGIARAIALGGNAHSRLYFVRNRTEVRRLPVRLWAFRDGFHVVRTTPAHRDLLGLKLVAIGGTAVEEAERRVADLLAGNASWRRYLAPYLLTSAEVLAGTGLAEDPERPAFTFERADGTRVDVALAPLPLRRSTKPVEAWWDLSPEHRPADGETWVSAHAPGAVPVALRSPERAYLAAPLAGGRVLYVRYSRAGEDGTEPFQAFAARVLEDLARGGYRGVVVDLRYNTGGDNGVARAFFEALRERLRGRALHVVVGRATFSGGLFHAAQLRSVPGAVFVGEPPGDALDYWSEGGNVILPNSGLAAHFANGFHSYSPAPHPGVEAFEELSVRSVAPDRHVEPAFADWAAGRDPVLDAILGAAGIAPQP